MPTVTLADRAVIDVAGPDAEHFLQNILTTDLAALGEGEAKPGALLTPQGKILFDFVISRGGPERLRLDVRAALADDFVRRLTMYKLRAKAEIVKQEQLFVGVRWPDDSTASQIDSSGSESDSTGDSGLSDTRFPAEARVGRRYGAAGAATAGETAWHRLRIRHGVAESGSDYEAGDAFPHDVLLDQNGGVGMRKGCYVGQEVVSRMQHRGTARRRVLLALADDDLPAAGTDITAGGRAVGRLGSVDGGAGLAIVRIDRVKDAVDAGLPVMAGETELALTIPPWAKFTFPETSAPAGEE